MKSYSVDELEMQSGFDRRTIAYYVQEGLIPGAGRRGRRARYPEEALDRLLFIGKVREAEETGKIEAVSLNKIKEIFDIEDPELIALVVDGERPVNDAITSVADQRGPQPSAMGIDIEDYESGAEDTEASSESNVIDDLYLGETDELLDGSTEAALSMSEDLDMSLSFEEPTTKRMPFRDDNENELAKALAELQENTLSEGEPVPGTVNRWSRVEISPGIALSVRSVTDDDALLLESVGKELRRLLNRGQKLRRGEA